MWADAPEDTPLLYSFFRKELTIPGKKARQRTSDIASYDQAFDKIEKALQNISAFRYADDLTPLDEAKKLLQYDTLLTSSLTTRLSSISHLCTAFFC
jgi:hypothetical protein